MLACDGVHMPVPQEPTPEPPAPKPLRPFPYRAVPCCTGAHVSPSGHDEQISHTHSKAVLNHTAFHLANVKWRALAYIRNKRACKRRTGPETVSE